MNICILHGYLLTGTGSNIYVQNLARFYCLSGHNVYLLCQEPHPKILNFVNKTFVFENRNTSCRLSHSKKTRYPGKCFVFRPDIGELLLVYVHDRYGNLRVKEFTDASTEEIETFITLNADALRTILKKYRIDTIQANHLIAQPQIAARAVSGTAIPYVITAHGSALNFSIKKDRRLRRYALEGIENAGRLFAVSDHNRKEIVSFFAREKPGLENKIPVIPCGVDIRRFNLLKTTRRKSVEKLAGLLREKIGKNPAGKTPEIKSDFSNSLKKISTTQDLSALIRKTRKRYNERFPDTDAPHCLIRTDWENGKIVLFLGKYLWSKGIQLIIASLPFVLRKVPEAHFIFVGFGSSREALETMLRAISTGNEELFRAALGLLSHGHIKKTDSTLEDFFIRLFHKDEKKEYFRLGKRVKPAEKVCFTGIFTHDELPSLLPCADLLVAPSIFPEAFGMVGIEALACGVLPLLTYHTGFKEIKDAVIAEFPEEFSDIKKLRLDRNLVFNLADGIIDILRNDALHQSGAKKRLRRIAREGFSWKTVAKKYIEEFEKLLAR